MYSPQLYTVKILNLTIERSAKCMTELAIAIAAFFVNICMVYLITNFVRSACQLFNELRHLSQTVC